MPMPSYPTPNVYHPQKQVRPRNSQPVKPDRTFIELPEPISTFLPKFLASNLLDRVPSKTLTNTLPNNHDPNARYSYHMNVPGQSLENY